MKKRTVSILLSALFLLGLIAGAAASGAIREIKAQLRPDFTVKVDGKVREFKNVNGEVVEPILYDGTTYLPLRAIGELMGKRVYWYENEKLIELKEEKTTVTDADVIVTESEKVVSKDSEKKPTVDEKNFIGSEKAQEIALKKAGVTTSDVIFDRTELDQDNGIWHYEVEFRRGNIEYSADVKADDGTILDWEVENDD